MDSISGEPSSNKELITSLANKLTGTPISERQKAARLLGDLNDPEAIELLIHALVDLDVLEIAVKSLEKLTRGQIVKTLAANLDDDDYNIRRDAAIGLGRISNQEEAIDILIPALKHQDWLVRWHATLNLGKLANPRALRPLLEVLQRREEILDVRSVAVSSLAEFLKRSDGEVVEVFRQLILDKEELLEVRADIIFISGEFGEVQLRSAIQQVLREEPDELIADYAAEALAKLKENS